MPPPSPNPPPSHTHKPRPTYFLVRPTGKVVPLIAIDELPPTLSITGVQRSLDLEDTVGMLNLGLQKGSGGFYHIEDTIKTTTPAPKAPKPNPLKETNLCRHWCTHGICKWGQACRYKHNMPLSITGLSEVGLQDWPVWFRTLNPGFFIQGIKGGRLQRPVNYPASTSISSGNVGRIGQAELRLGKKEESLGEQIVERLRSMEREKERARDGREGVKGRGSVQAPRANGREREEKRAKSLNVSVAVERAAVRDARRWEEESEESAEGSVAESSGSEGETAAVPAVAKREGVLKGKLVDV